MSLAYTVREAFSSFTRTKLASAGSALTICVALLLLGTYYIISLNAAHVISMIRERVEVEAFCEEPLNHTKMLNLQQQLLAVEGVERVQFVSKDDAAKIFKREFGEDIGNVLDFNPLPPSFKIDVRDEYKSADRLDTVVAHIKSLRDVDDVVYRRDLVEFLDRRMGIAHAAGLGLGLLLGVSAIFLVSNTIRLAIYAKRKIIRTMKLVGATRWFIRMPFLLEGLMQGVIGGALAAGLIYWLIEFVSRRVLADLTEFMRVDNLFYAVIVGCGAFLGLFGSFISIRRFIGETVVN